MVGLFLPVNASAIPTLHLLNASSIVACAGCFRIFVAILLAGIAPNPSVIIGYGLIVYSTYTFDRAIGCGEDAINRHELLGADQRIGMIASIAAFTAGAVLLACEQIYLASFLPFIIGYVYSKGLTIGGYSFKLKGSLGSKNIVIGITWGGSIALIISRYNSDIFTISAIFLFFCGKMFINSALYDFKDVKGDLESGIRTLPVCLGEKRTKMLLIASCLAIYSAMIVSINQRSLQPEWILLSVSFAFTASFICYYSVGFEERVHGTMKKFRQWMVIGEWPVALAAVPLAATIIALIV